MTLEGRSPPFDFAQGRLSRAPAVREMGHPFVPTELDFVVDPQSSGAGDPSLRLKNGYAQDEPITLILVRRRL